MENKYQGIRNFLQDHDLEVVNDGVGNDKIININNEKSEALVQYL